MDVRIKLGSNWSSKVSQIYMSIGGVWKSFISGYMKIGTQWKQFFARVLTPVNTVKPSVTGSTYLYGTLSGTLGTWTAPNGTNSYARQWQRADYDGSSTPGTFSNISGATSSTYTTTINDNGKWIRLRITATNLSGSDTAFSELDYISKYSPVALTIPVINGSASVGSTLTALTTIGTYWRNTTTNSGDTAPDSFTYRWYWGDTGENIGSNSSTYTVQSTDLDHTIRVDVTATNTGGSTTSTSAQTATVGQAIGISNIVFEDSNGNTGFNNRGNLVTATALTLKWKVSGVNTSTTFRVRYRVLNNNTGAYWNPGTETVETASAAWISYSSNYYNSGASTEGISNVTIDGTDALIYDLFTIPEIFDGSTYSGGISKWTWEYEISAVIGGTRYYWVPGDTVSTSFTFDYWDIDPTSLGTITATPSSPATNVSVTFTGIIQSYPTGLNTYPYAYRVVYGDGNNSGWVYPSYGTSKPSYSLSHSYSTAGSYTAYVETIPDYSTSTATVTVVTPVIPTVTIQANSGVSSTAGTINWTSTNQAKYSVAGTGFETAETTSTSARSVSKTGLTPSTNYAGTITVKSSTGNTATANYSLTTDAAPIATPNVTQIQATGLGNTSAPYINFTFTSTDAASLSYMVHRSSNSSSGPWTPLSARIIRDTTGSLTVGVNSRTGNTSNWYYVDVVPYSGSNATGTAGTSRVSRSRRGTQESSATLYP
jgi:hypothetical protein